MISDVLSDAVVQIRGYLDDKTFDKVYVGQMRTDIKALMQIMDMIRRRLDNPGNWS